MTLRPNSVARIADVIAQELETRILEGVWKQGDRLPSERDLALELGVSRPSLREAIQKLVSKGLLRTRHGGGTYVTDQLEAPFVDPWQTMLTGHPMLQSDMLEFREMLESQAAYLAAERATAADLTLIETRYNELEQFFTGQDLTGCIEKDVAFHQALAEASHNVLIGHLTASLFRVIHGHISSNLDHLWVRRPSWDQLTSQHRAIWHAIRDHQPEAAAKAAGSHIEFVRQSMADTAKVADWSKSALRRLGAQS